MLGHARPAQPQGGIFRRLIAIILLLVVVLCLWVPVSAEAQDWSTRVEIDNPSDPGATIYVVGDPQLVATALRAVSRVISPSSGSSTLYTALKIALLISFLFAVTAWFTRGQMRLIPFLGMMFLSWVLFLNTTNVRVQTYFSYSGAYMDTGKVGMSGGFTGGSTVNTVYGAARSALVSDVPLGLALPASLSGAITTAIADLFAVSMQNPTATNYTDGSFGFVDPLKILLRLRASNPCVSGNLCRNMFEYARYCTQRANASDGQLEGPDMARVVTRSDAMKYYLLDMNDALPSSTVHYFGNASSSDTISSAPELVTCREAGQRIYAAQLAFENAGIARVMGAAAAGSAPSANEVTAAAFSPDRSPTAALQYLTAGTLTDAAAMVAQARFWPVVEAGLIASNEPIDRATTMAYTLVQDAISQYHVDGAGEGSVFVRTMFNVMNVMLFILICMTPIVFLMAAAMMMQGFTLIREYLVAVVWTQTWFPAAIVINYYITESVIQQITSYRTGLAGVSILSPSSHSAFFEALSSSIASAGWMMGAVPLLSYALLRGSTQAMAQLAQRAGGAGGSGYIDQSKASPSLDSAVNAKALTSTPELFGGSAAGIGLGVGASGVLNAASASASNLSANNVQARTAAATAQTEAARSALVSSGDTANQMSGLGIQFSNNKNASDTFQRGLSGNLQQGVTAAMQLSGQHGLSAKAVQSMALALATQVGTTGSASAGISWLKNGAGVVKSIAAGNGVTLNDQQATELAQSIASGFKLDSSKGQTFSAQGAISTLGNLEKAFGQNWKSDESFSKFRQAQASLVHADKQSQAASATTSTGGSSTVTNGQLYSLVGGGNNQLTPRAMVENAAGTLQRTGESAGDIGASIAKLNALTSAGEQQTSDRALAFANAIMGMSSSNNATDRALSGAVMQAAAGGHIASNSPALTGVATAARNVGSALVEANSGEGAKAISNVPAAIGQAQGEVNTGRGRLNADVNQGQQTAGTILDAGNGDVSKRVETSAIGAARVVSVAEQTANANPVPSPEQIRDDVRAQATQTANQGLVGAATNLAEQAGRAKTDVIAPSPNAQQAAPGTNMGVIDSAGLTGDARSNAIRNTNFASGAGDTSLLSLMAPGGFASGVQWAVSDVGKGAGDAGDINARATMDNIFRGRGDAKALQSNAYQQMAQNLEGARAGTTTAITAFGNAAAQAYGAEVALSGQLYSPSLAGKIATPEFVQSMIGAIDQQSQQLSKFGEQPPAPEVAARTFIQAYGGTNNPSNPAPSGGGGTDVGKSPSATPATGASPLLAPFASSGNTSATISLDGLKEQSQQAGDKLRSADQALVAGVESVDRLLDAGRITKQAADQRKQNLYQELGLPGLSAANAGTKLMSQLPSEGFAQGVAIAATATPGSVIGAVRGAASLMATRAAANGTAALPSPTGASLSTRVALATAAGKGAVKGAALGAGVAVVPSVINQVTGDAKNAARSLSSAERPIDPVIQQMNAAAAARVGIPLASLSLIVRAESGGQIPNKPLTAIAGGSARGVTQFLSGTWVGEALRNGTYLNQVSLARGLVVADSAGRFSIAPGKEQELLGLRDDVRTSIEAAADYTRSNLDRLRRANVEGIGDLSGLSDKQVAQYGYVLHLAGPGDGVSLIRSGTVEGGATRASQLLAAQFKQGNESKGYKHYMAQAGNDAQVAFRNFVAAHARRHAA